MALTVEEWLNNEELPITIWKNKYRNGEESFEEWLDRVSGGNDELRQLIIEKKFLFGGRTLANRGTNKKGSYSNCFTSGHKIFTSEGLKPIECIKTGDLVLGEDNNFHKVNDVMCRHYTGDLYKISSSYLYEDIICTPNHRFLTQNGWKRADRIEALPMRIVSADRLKIPNYTQPFKPSTIDLLEYTKYFPENKRYELIEDKIQPITDIQNYSKTTGYLDSTHEDKKAHAVNRYITFDEEFSYFVGRWLGDGSITTRKGQENPSILQIVFNATTEREAANRIINDCKHYFGFEPSVRETDQNIISVRVESELISIFFLQNFGQKCDGKYVPDKYLGNLNMALGLLDSDGSINTHGGIKIVLKNYNLLKWLRDTLFLNGICTKSIKSIGYRQVDSYELNIGTFMCKGKLSPLMTKSYFDKREGKTNVKDLDLNYISITNIEVLENQEVDVYNLSVEKVHSYVVNGVIAHNCYSIGYVPDSLDGILKVNSDIALTFKAQGGQGLSLSKIRPKGSPINNQFKSDGIVPFMEMFNTTTNSISQGGSRKGALLMSLDIWHKEAEQFITIKSQEGKIEKANLSLEIDDKFMKYIDDYYKGLISEDKIIHIVREYEGNTVEYDVQPVKLYKLMMKTVYNWGEPGCIFTNRFRNYNMMQFHSEYKIETCNPCGEQPLSPYSACNLGSINLSKFVKDPFVSPEFDYSSFADAVCLAIDALDTVLDENLDNHALPEQKQKSIDYRNVGLGIMGLADALIMMKLRYGSAEAQLFCKSIMSVMFNAAVCESILLAKEKGSFPKYESTIWNSDIIKSVITKETIEKGKKYGIRNCSLLSIAPTGSLATLLNGIGGGCEPYFAFEYNRTTKSLNGGEDKTYKQYAPIVKLYREIYPEGNLPEYFVTSENIYWKDRVDMQAALQFACDTAISSTVNLPENTTREEIEQLYLYAWNQGLKGITIFRSGCQRQAILSTDKKEDKEQEVNIILTDTDTTVKKVSDDCIGKKRTLTTGCGTLHLTAFFDRNTGRLLETYFSKGSTGGCALFMVGLSRMVSLAARANVSIDAIVDQLKSSGTCPAYAVRKATKGDTSKGSCCPVAIGYALMDMYNEMQRELNDCLGHSINLQLESPHAEEQSVPKCPKCGNPIYMTEGCMTCPSCGHSRCS